MAHWRAGVLGTSVVACALVLDLTVLGANPRVDVNANTAPAVDAGEATAVDPASGAAAPNSVDLAVPPVSGPDGGSPHAPSDPVLPTDKSAVIGSDIGTVIGRTVTTVGIPATSPGVGVPAPPPAPVIVARPTSAPQPPASTTTSTAPRTAVPTTTVPPRAPSSAGVPTTPPTTAPPTTAPSTTAPAAAPPTTATTAPPTTAPIDYPSYTVSGGVGSVTLMHQGSTIGLSSFSPNAGWVYQVESNGPSVVKLKFFNTETQQDREWTAQLEGSRIQIEN